MARFGRAGLLAAWQRHGARFQVMVTPATALEAGAQGASLDESGQLSEQPVAQVLA